MLSSTVTPSPTFLLTITLLFSSTLLGQKYATASTSLDNNNSIYHYRDSIDGSVGSINDTSGESILPYNNEIYLLNNNYDYYSCWYNAQNDLFTGTVDSCSPDGFVIGCIGGDNSRDGSSLVPCIEGTSGTCDHYNKEDNITTIVKFYVVKGSNLVEDISENKNSQCPDVIPSRMNPSTYSSEEDSLKNEELQLSLQPSIQESVSRYSLEPSYIPLRPTSQISASPVGAEHMINVTVVIRLDQYPEEIGWGLYCDDEKAYAENPSGTYSSNQEEQRYQFAVIEESFNVEEGKQCFFVITDTFGDGLLCDDNGSFDEEINEIYDSTDGEIGDMYDEIEYNTTLPAEDGLIADEIFAEENTLFPCTTYEVYVQNTPVVIGRNFTFISEVSFTVAQSSAAPSASMSPTVSGSAEPTVTTLPSLLPSLLPSTSPSLHPSLHPSLNPSLPTTTSSEPSKAIASGGPSSLPSVLLSSGPTHLPSYNVEMKNFIISLIDVSPRRMNDDEIAIFEQSFRDILNKNNENNNITFVSVSVVNQTIRLTSQHQRRQLRRGDTDSDLYTNDVVTEITSKCRHCRSESLLLDDAVDTNLDDLQETLRDNKSTRYFSEIDGIAAQPAEQPFVPTQAPTNSYRNGNYQASTESTVNENGEDVGTLIGLWMILGLLGLIFFGFVVWLAIRFHIEKRNTTDEIIDKVIEANVTVAGCLTAQSEEEQYSEQKGEERRTDELQNKNGTSSTTTDDDTISDRSEQIDVEEGRESRDTNNLALPGAVAGTVLAGKEVRSQKRRTAHASSRNGVVRNSGANGITADNYLQQPTTLNDSKTGLATSADSRNTDYPVGGIMAEKEARHQSLMRVHAGRRRNTRPGAVAIPGQLPQNLVVKSNSEVSAGGILAQKEATYQKQRAAHPRSRQKSNLKAAEFISRSRHQTPKQVEERNDTPMKDQEGLHYVPSFYYDER